MKTGELQRKFIDKLKEVHPHLKGNWLDDDMRKNFLVIDDILIILSLIELEENESNND